MPAEDRISALGIHQEHEHHEYFSASATERIFPATSLLRGARSNKPLTQTNSNSRDGLRKLRQQSYSKERGDMELPTTLVNDEGASRDEMSPSMTSLFASQELQDQTGCRVQKFGLFFIFQQQSESVHIRTVSKNCYEFIGYHTDELLHTDDISQIFPPDQASILDDNFNICVQCKENAYRAPTSYMFAISIRHRSGHSVPCWATIRNMCGEKTSFICEFERKCQAGHPSVCLKSSSSLAGADTTRRSKSRIRKPLSIKPDSADETRNEFDGMRFVDVFSSIERRIYAASSLSELLKALDEELYHLTGLENFQVYRFDKTGGDYLAWNQVQPQSANEPSPKPAPPIFTAIKALYTSSSVPLLHFPCQNVTQLKTCGSPDITTRVGTASSLLHAPSVEHLQDLEKTNVTIAMSLPLDVFHRPWGLLSCHSSNASAHRVSFPERKLCQMVLTAVSGSIERLSYSTSLRSWKTVNSIVESESAFDTSLPRSHQLLDLFDSDFGMITVKDERVAFGSMDRWAQYLTLLDHVRAQELGSIAAYNNIARSLPSFPSFRDCWHASDRLLFIPLSETGTDYIAFMRSTRQRRHDQANDGNEENRPYHPTLHPCETHDMSSVESEVWSDHDMEAAEVLRLVYTVMLHISRNVSLKKASSTATRLLLGNTAHEVRTPLNAVINYLELGMGGALDPQVRQQLKEAFAAALSIVQSVNELND